MAPAADPHARHEEFVRLIAHDLRNPLTAVQLNGQLIEQAALHAGLDKQRRWARLVVDAARRIDDLLGKLVEAERIRSGQMALAQETVVLTQLLPDVLSGMGEDAARVRVRVPPEPLAIPGDRARIGQALAVLVRVAGQEADPDSDITVELSAGAGTVGCAIRGGRWRQGPDHGTPAASPVGRGILEHFARTIVECHGGTLRAEVGDDSAFGYDVTLPAAPEEP